MKKKRRREETSFTIEQFEATSTIESLGKFSPQHTLGPLLRLSNVILASYCANAAFSLVLSFSFLPIAACYSILLLSTTEKSVFTFSSRTISRCFWVKFTPRIAQLSTQIERQALYDVNLCTNNANNFTFTNNLTLSRHRHTDYIFSRSNDSTVNENWKLSFASRITTTSRYG